MIRSILLTSLISFASTGGASIKKDAPLTSNEAETRQELRAEETNPSYNDSWDFPFVQQINSPWVYTWPETTSQVFSNYYYFNQKNHNYTRNNAWSIDATMYSQNKIIGLMYPNGQRYGGFDIYERDNNNNHEFDTNSNNNLCIYKYTPHNKAVSTNFTISTTSTVNLDIWQSDSLAQQHNNLEIHLYTRYTILTTQDEIVEQYVNTSITESSNFKNWYLNIAQNANDIVSETIYKDTIIGTISSQNQVTNNGQQLITLTTNLSNLGLTTTETNYAVILIERGIGFIDTTTNLYFVTNDNEIQLYDSWGSRNNDRFNYYWMHNTSNSIQGTYLLGTNIEVIDLPDLMFSILGMPFRFYSTAFNITWFAGTPYAINISNIILVVLASLIFIFIVRLILKVFK